MSFCITSFRLRKNPTSIFPYVSGTIALTDNVDIENLIDEEVDILDETYIIRSINYIGKNTVNFSAIHKDWKLEKYSLKKRVRFLSANTTEITVQQINKIFNPKKDVIEFYKYGGTYGERGWKVSDILNYFVMLLKYGEIKTDTQEVVVASFLDYYVRGIEIPVGYTLPSLIRQLLPFDDIFIKYEYGKIIIESSFYKTSNTNLYCVVSSNIEGQNVDNIIVSGVSGKWRPFEEDNDEVTIEETEYYKEVYAPTKDLYAIESQQTKTEGFTLDYSGENPHNILQKYPVSVESALQEYVNGDISEFIKKIILLRNKEFKFPREYTYNYTKNEFYDLSAERYVQSLILKETRTTYATDTFREEVSNILGIDLASYHKQVTFYQYGLLKDNDIVTGYKQLKTVTFTFAKLFKTINFNSLFWYGADGYVTDNYGQNIYNYLDPQTFTDRNYVEFLFQIFLYLLKQQIENKGISKDKKIQKFITTIYAVGKIWDVGSLEKKNFDVDLMLIIKQLNDAQMFKSQCIMFAEKVKRTNLRINDVLNENFTPDEILEKSYDVIECPDCRSDQRILQNFLSNYTSISKGGGYKYLRFDEIKYSDEEIYAELSTLLENDNEINTYLTPASFSFQNVMSYDQEHDLIVEYQSTFTNNYLAQKLERKERVQKRDYFIANRRLRTRKVTTHLSYTMPQNFKEYSIKTSNWEEVERIKSIIPQNYYIVTEDVVFHRYSDLQEALFWIKDYAYSYSISVNSETDNYSIEITYYKKLMP